MKTGSLRRLLHHDDGGWVLCCSLLLSLCPADVIEIDVEQEGGPSSKPEVGLSALLPAAASGDFEPSCGSLTAPARQTSACTSVRDSEHCQRPFHAQRQQASSKPCRLALHSSCRRWRRITLIQRAMAAAHLQLRTCQGLVSAQWQPEATICNFNELEKCWQETYTYPASLVLLDGQGHSAHSASLPSSQ